MSPSKPKKLPASALMQDLDLHPIDQLERDACALICSVRKGGQPTHGNVKRTIEALSRMGHRTGYINGEGDGVGVLTDIPRLLWSKWLSEAGMIASAASDRNFWVAHVMIPAADRPRAKNIVDVICRSISESGLHILTDRPGNVNRLILGPNAEKNEPVFWQIAGINGQVPSSKLESTLFELQVRLEDELGVHFPSFSSHSVVYKVQGTIEILRRYYPELRDPDYASTVTMGHARYSTNTNSVFERVQPFNLLGHNGEFNTISRLRLEANMLDIPLPVNGSDSQDVDRLIHALVARYGLDLIEAMEYVFPPYQHDLIQNNSELHAIYEEMRQAFGHFAQGPAAVAARMGNLLVFSVDALGLRPLWFGETEKEYFASSERGVYYLDGMSVDAKPMGPGEKIALKITPGHKIEVLDYPAIQQHVYKRYLERHHPVQRDSTSIWSMTTVDPRSTRQFPMSFGNGKPSKLSTGETQAAPAATTVAIAEAPQSDWNFNRTMSVPWLQRDIKLNTATMAAFGWERYHLSLVETLAETGKEQIGSLGWDGPLAAMSHTRVNIADYFKETVAVVTNPAIDREREASQFSTRMVIGVRPQIAKPRHEGDLLVQIETPFLVGGHKALGSTEVMQRVADKFGTLTIEQLVQVFADRLVILQMSAAMDENLETAVERIAQAAVNHVKQGVQCIILDDTDVIDGTRLWIDPLLVVAAVDRALRTHDSVTNLRRMVGIVLRSGALRDLHDIAMSISFGANAVNPYALYAATVGIAPKGGTSLPSDDEAFKAMCNAVKALTLGLQKVTSTIGCHELRGYGHSFSSIGLSKGVAALFDTPNYFGSEGRGLTWGMLRSDAEERAADLRGETKARLVNPDRLYPKMWKKVEDVALGEKSLEEYSSELQDLENKIPVTINHLIHFREVSRPVPREAVDLHIGNHSMPLIISAMSYGSQGELAYKAYAEAAYKLNTICINGEGGEMADVMGKYPRNRGQQVASARFGVNIGFLNSCDYIEIKIGQGAKPGEGGHLPGFKVTEQVAASRGTPPGIDLISPSNNHDLYSIEDLAQLIDELKTANPLAKVSVKIPVVPGVGIIAVGVAKAGADIITITGYTGGTGAARMHALRHVGLPAEIGVWLAHRALLESGLRDGVEIWADGGMKSGRDAMKMICLGANRVGFGTLAMVAVGCTICRGCQEGTCHVGITTHVKTREEAELKGFKSFRPFEERGSSDAIVRVFNMLAEEVRQITAKLGALNPQELVGRADLLEQCAMHDRIDLSQLLKPAPKTPKKPAQPGGRRLSRPRNTVSRQITEVIKEYVRRGEFELTYDDDQVMAMDRALGTHLNGALKRGEIPNSDQIEAINLSFSNSAIPGNGLGAFIDEPLNIVVEGGAQDGVGKGAKGGRITILKGLNHNGTRLDGSVGKSFAYGAQGGLFIVQGNADTRACIRMSGADVIFGGEVKTPLNDDLGGLAARANLKGYAFEYMTSGRALVLGDPGPWICAGMTGGVVYQRIQPEMNLTVDAIRRRIAPGAVVDIMPVDEQGERDIRDLLGIYIKTLELNNQSEATHHLYALLARPTVYFVKIAVPQRVN
jgi:glutamate synthase (NADPH/NADH) large chain